MIRLYFSHPIRGGAGADATEQDIMRNNLTAMKMGRAVRAFFPHVDLYVPAEHDEVLSHLYLRKAVTIEDLLAADCSVLFNCDGVISFQPEFYESHGMRVEREYAESLGMPVFTMSDIDSGTRQRFERFLEKHGWGEQDE